MRGDELHLPIDHRAGTLDSQGTFTLDPQKAWEKLARYSGLDGLLTLVRAAVSAGATQLHVRLQATSLSASFDGAAPDLDSLFDSELGRAVFALLKGTDRWATIGRGERELLVESGPRWRTQELVRPTAKTRVHVACRQNWLTRNLQAAHLKHHARWAPLQLLVNGIPYPTDLNPRGWKHPLVEEHLAFGLGGPSQALVVRGVTCPWPWPCPLPQVHVWVRSSELHLDLDGKAPVRDSLLTALEQRVEERLLAYAADRYEHLNAAQRLIVVTRLPDRGRARLLASQGQGLPMLAQWFRASLQVHELDKAWHLLEMLEQQLRQRERGLFRPTPPSDVLTGLPEAILALQPQQAERWLPRLRALAKRLGQVWCHPGVADLALGLGQPEVALAMAREHAQIQALHAPTPVRYALQRMPHVWSELGKWSLHAPAPTVDMLPPGLARLTRRQAADWLYEQARRKHRQQTGPTYQWSGQRLYQAQQIYTSLDLPVEAARCTTLPILGLGRARRRGMDVHPHWLERRAALPLRLLAACEGSEARLLEAQVLLELGRFDEARARLTEDTPATRLELAILAHLEGSPPPSPENYPPECWERREVLAELR